MSAENEGPVTPIALLKRIEAAVQKQREDGELDLRTTLHFIRREFPTAEAMAVEPVNQASAITAFAAWLTCRKEAVTFGSTHDAAPAAELVGRFCEAQGYGRVSENFPKNLKPYPPEVGDVVKMKGAPDGVADMTVRGFPQIGNILHVECDWFVGTTHRRGIFALDGVEPVRPARWTSQYHETPEPVAKHWQMEGSDPNLGESMGPPSMKEPRG